MTQEQKNAIIVDRYNKLKEKKINEKCPGVLRKLSRQIRNMNK